MAGRIFLIICVTAFAGTMPLDQYSPVFALVNGEDSLEARSDCYAIDWYKGKCHQLHLGLLSWKRQRA